MKPRKPLALLFILFFFSSGFFNVSSAEGGRNQHALFNAITDGDAWEPPDDPTIIRARRVTINYDILVSDTTGVLLLNLFDDVVLTAELDTLKSTIPEFFSWIGHIDGIRQSNVILIVGEGIVQGSITLPDAFYQISHLENGVHAIYEIDQAAFPNERDPIPVDVSDTAIAFDGISADDGSVIDVIVFYTEAARVTAGGKDNIIAQILKAGQDTNIGYANSGVIQSINLIDLYAYNPEVQYDETDLDWEEALRQLRSDDDGIMDGVHELRDRYHADIVVLMVNDQTYCGASFSMRTLSPDFASSAFSLVSRNCSVSNYSLAHELGHVMGSQHDRANASDAGIYSYSHGYQEPAGAFRTLMAYDCPSGCKRLNYWSNPEIEYNGQPMGVAEGEDLAADNRKSLNHSSYTVANFRTAMPETGNLTVTLGPSEAVAAGAQWRIAGESTWRNSGVTQSGIVVGGYTIEFKAVSGWTPAGGKSVQIASGETATTSGTYVQQTGALTVTINPAAARAAGAQWRIAGESTWRNSGDTQNGIAVGDCTIEFKTVAEWTAPDNQRIAISNGGNATFNGNYTPLVAVEDSDQDGVSDAEEDSGPNDGDGNGDGIPDSRQAHVATLKTIDESMITLEAASGVSIRDCAVVESPPTGSAPSGFEFPYGFLRFSLVGVDPGGAVSVTLYLPDGDVFDAYYKFGPTEGDTTDHWYDFSDDGETGAVINGNRVTLRFIDGQRGDDDLVADGTIIDIGGPGISTVTTSGENGDVQNDSGSGGGGGGCFIGASRI